MSQLRGLIQKLEHLREDLITPRVFYAAHRQAWRELAATVARQVLTNLRPPSADPDGWARQVDLAAARVAAELVGEDDAGLIIYLTSAPAAEPVDIATRFGFSVEEVMRWVADGRGENPDGLGKRLDERDAGKSDRQIAWRILYALKLNKPGAEGLRGALNAFFGRESGDQADAFYPEILKAWLDIFTMRAAADFRAWVHQRVRQV